MEITNEHIKRVITDERLCKSNNMQKFFRSQTGRKMANYLEVIRFEGVLYFATLGWLARGEENGFAGVRVVEVACQGAKAKTGYPSWQKGGDYEIVTDWFWSNYWHYGMVALPEIWRQFKNIPKQLTHAELHTI